MSGMLELMSEMMCKLWCNEEIEDRVLKNHPPLMIDIYRGYLVKKFKNVLD